MLFQLIYISSAHAESDIDLFKSIATDSQVKNTRLGVTGLLLHCNGTVMQIIEGEEVNVRDLYKRIEIDPRHKNPIVMDQKYIYARQFPDWQMGFKNIDDINDLDFMFDLDSSSFRNRLPKDPPASLIAITNSYARASGLDPKY